MDAVKEKLEAVFNDIAQTRMAGLPICNPALRVQVVGLREWEGRWIGVLITPWTIALVLVAGENAPLDVLAPEQKTIWELPSGKYTFMGLNEPGLGTCQICSLISPIPNVRSHGEAVNIAWELIAGLFMPAEPLPNHDAAREAMLASATPMVQSLEKKPLSRRDFLRGNFLGK
jgi:[NiFe] hydrogenase assembly HybE family chaperone